MNTHQCSGTFAVEIQVTDVEFAPSTFQPSAVVAEQCPSEAVLGAVGDAQRIVKITGANNGQEWPKNFLLGDAGIPGNVTEDRRWNEVTVTRRMDRLTTQQ